MKVILAIIVIALSAVLAWEHRELKKTRAELAERYNQLGVLNTAESTCKSELAGEHQLLEQVVGRKFN